MRILADHSGAALVELREAHVACGRLGEVIVDLNRQGNWIRGFEVIGGMLDFSLQLATLPYVNRKSPGLLVTYDQDVDAAYFLVTYGTRFTNLSRFQRESVAVYSHSINPTAQYLLDSHGGLVSVMFSVSDAVESVESFFHLFNFELQDRVVSPIGRNRY